MNPTTRNLSEDARGDRAAASTLARAIARVLPLGTRAAIATIFVVAFAAPAIAQAASANVVFRASVSSAGVQSNDAILDLAMSGDGKVVAFDSAATNLMPSEPNGSIRDVFVRVLASGETTRVSVASGGVNGSSQMPSLSSDGRYVSFDSAGTNIVAGDTNSAKDVFVYDRQSSTTVRASVSATGTQGNGLSQNARLSADGRWVVFESDASNLVAGDTNGKRDIFVRDLVSGTTVRASQSATGTAANGASYMGSISDDGRYVAFESDASNLVAGDTNGQRDVFVKDLQTGAVVRASVSTAGAQSAKPSYTGNISGNGRYVAFDSAGGEFAASDTNGLADVFVRDLTANSTRIVSQSASSTAGNGAAILYAQTSQFLSPDGRYIVFDSAANNLVAGDTNGTSDSFIRDLSTDSLSLVSQSSTGTLGNSSSISPAVANDGQTVAFYSNATNLIAGDTNAKADLYVRKTVSAVSGVTMSYGSFNASNTAGFKFNGNAKLDSATGALRLTDNVNWQSGSVFSQQRITLGPKRAFSTAFKFYLHDTSGGVADGMTFCLQPTTNSAVAQGGGLGYQGIKPSVAVEFDTFYNNGYNSNEKITYTDPNSNHIGIDLNGDVNSTCTAVPSFTMYNSVCWAWVDYDGTNMEVRISQTPTRPMLPTLKYAIDLSQVIGTECYAGFTGATGASNEYHDVQNWYFDNAYAPAGLQPETTAYIPGPALALTSSGTTATVVGGNVTTLTATFKDNSAQPVADWPATFTATAGNLNQLAPATDKNGKISAEYSAPSKPGSYTVSVSGDGGITADFAIRVPDTTAPTSTALGLPSNAWTTQPATVTITATDDSTGTVTTYYSLNGGLAKIYSLPFSISTDGTTTLKYWSVDAAGNIETARTATVRLDRTIPSVSISGLPSQVTSSNVTFTLDATDTYSGVSAILYSVNGSDERVYGGPVTFAIGGTYKLTYRAVDFAGNSSAERTGSFIIHNTTPTSSISSPAVGWVATPVNLRATGAESDGSKVSIVYSIDDSLPVTAAAPCTITVATDGMHYVNYHAIDEYGAREQGDHRAIVRVDLSGPSTTLKGIGAGSQPTPVVFTLSAADPYSGVDHTEYSLDGKTWLRYAHPTMIAPVGGHTLQWASVDNLGNREATQSVTFTLADAAARRQGASVSSTGTGGGVPWDYKGQITGDVSAGARLSMTVTGANLHYGTPKESQKAVPEIYNTRTVFTNTGDSACSLLIEGDGPAKAVSKNAYWDMLSRAGKDTFRWIFNADTTGDVNVLEGTASDLGDLGYNDSRDFGSAIDMPTYTSAVGKYQWSATAWVTDLK